MGRKPKSRDFFGTVYRDHAVVTNQASGDPDFILDRHRRHAGVENPIKGLENGCGLSLPPCSSHKASHAWFFPGTMARSLTVILKVLYLAGKWAENTIKTKRLALIPGSGIHSVAGKRIPAAI